MALAHVANPRRATANLPPDRFAYARTHHRACIVYVLEPITYCEKAGARAEVRWIEAFTQ
jgi:hypothetical protein